ncbi:MAG TPA: hydrogenase 3 maturation endopeptidase HyCI [Aggregatilineales bacterium]|nr:hydrogenase 3 maturation endopeptidase HyCI [Aggregatilineales bacterium]
MAVLGVGQALCADDAAGVLVARHLRPAAHRLVIDGGPAPENYAGALLDFAPDLILMVDAARMDAPPGTVAWIPLDDVGGFSGSSHTLPLRVLAQYLSLHTAAEIALIGIQPDVTQFDAEPTQPVLDAVAEVIATLALSPVQLESAAISGTTSGSCA